ncbi:hypothetical protein [Psychroflexus planctonicus]|uniref:Uncharacterized protein n=1 Tax=Psychroflexus planctonicus TaxID=1526575 RepID=A0ABQ1SM06_9FLAO|nr:hypothetical protein [Psychroflexus planctonicus]GGE43319.1 hypothetical protein GCM10010832_24070 [Psychroflexus planctonicus]
MHYPLIHLDFPDREYSKLIDDALRYALLSAPFTVDRMALLGKKEKHQATTQRIFNIFKGKLAESLFEYFCHINALQADFDVCTTPYYQIDKRDFSYGNLEFDIKNNFIYHAGDFFSDYKKLPALIPNRFPNDQWDSRLKPFIKQEVGYIFSFMKAAGLHNQKRGKYFVELKLTKQQTDFIHSYFMKYQGLPQNEAVFKAEKYIHEILKSEELSDLYKIHFYPKLVVAGSADKMHWDVFKNIGPFETDNHFQNDPFSNWYSKVGNRKSISFLNGTIWGIITNKTLPVQFLNPITKLFPKLKSQLVGGKWL